MQLQQLESSWGSSPRVSEVHLRYCATYMYQVRLMKYYLVKFYSNESQNQIGVLAERNVWLSNPCRDSCKIIVYSSNTIGIYNGFHVKVLQVLEGGRNPLEIFQCCGWGGWSLHCGGDNHQYNEHICQHVNLTETKKYATSNESRCKQTKPWLFKALYSLV